MRFLGVIITLLFQNVSALLKTWLLLPFVFETGFLPSRNQLPTVNIPTTITKVHPLPQEELVTSYSQGNSLLILGRFQEALTEFDKAVEVAPENGEVLVARGIAYEKLQRWQDAIADYKNANTLKKKNIFYRDDATVFSNLANAETGLELWEDALKDFTYATTLQPDFIAPQLGRNLVLFQLGQKQESLEYFVTLADKYPLFPDGRAVLAIMYYDAGDAVNAKENWDIAVEQDARYLDVSWVTDVRRWPPRLVSSLEQYLSVHKSIAN